MQCPDQGAAWEALGSSQGNMSTAEYTRVPVVCQLPVILPPGVKRRRITIRGKGILTFSTLGEAETLREGMLLPLLCAGAWDQGWGLGVMRAQGHQGEHERPAPLAGHTLVHNRRVLLLSAGTYLPTGISGWSGFCSSNQTAWLK